MQKIIRSIYKNISTNLRIFMACIFCIMPCVLYGMGGQFPNMSPEEIQAMEQELAQAAQAIDQYVSGLSPAEQEEFHRAVAEVEQMMSTMSEEELNQFFESVIAEELSQAQEVPQQPGATPGLPLPVKEPVTVVAEKPKFTNEQQRILTLLTSIIDHTDSFIVKMPNVPDIATKFIRWTRQGKLTTIGTEPQWDLFRGSIEKLKKELSDMRGTDAKTKQYLFIDAIIKNEPLLRVLTELESQLKTYEPRVIVTSLGIETLSADAKTAIQKIINAFALALQTTTIELKKIFETYEPEAQKIREEQQKQTERARTESAQPRRPTPTSSSGGRGYTGKQGAPYGSTGGGYGDYGSYGGYGQPSYGGYGPQQKGAPSAGETAKPSTPKGGGKGGGSIKQPGKDDEEKKKKKEAEEAKKKKEEEKTKGEKGLNIPGKKKKEKKPAVCPIDGAETPEGLLSLIKNNLEHIDTIIKESSNLLEDIETTITSNSKPDASLTIVTIPGLNRRARRINDLVTDYLKMTKNSIESRKKLHEELEQHDLFKKIVPQLKEITDKLKEDDALLQKIPTDKRYAYFANKLKPLDEKTKLTEPSPTVTKEFDEKSIGSLLDLYAILESIAEQTKIAETAPKKKPAIMRRPAPIVQPEEPEAIQEAGLTEAPAASSSSAE
jgi:hypothetical protein